MGEANLRYAKGEVDLATKICMEIIRQVLLLVYHMLIIKNVKHLLIFSSDKYQAPQNHSRR